MAAHTIGTTQEWTTAREQLLLREKEHTRLGDEIAQQRRDLPWVPVEKEYRFDTDDGEKTLVELFDGRSQLLVYHFMFGPSYDAGCTTCSSIADGINGVLPHLPARDVTLVLVSQARLEKLLAYRRRMGWSIPWVSAAGSDFNADLGFSSSEDQTREWVAPMLKQLPPIAGRTTSDAGTDVVGYLSESQGFSAFARDDGAVYHTYSTGGSRCGVPDGLLPDPRPRTQGTRRGRRVPALDPLARRVPQRVSVRKAAIINPCVGRLSAGPQRGSENRR
jgi:predicted dithiol-disulfide oxidoreductase (DUF899 family)